MVAHPSWTEEAHTGGAASIRDETIGADKTTHRSNPHARPYASK
ncbi:MULTISPECIES: hypothetical protein [Nocardia]|nr:hypothetical protein [Nocardia sputorum]